MTRKEIYKLCGTPDWRWGTSEGAELHTLLLGLASTFQEKLEWLEEAENVSMLFRANRKKMRKAKTRPKKSRR